MTSECDTIPDRCHQEFRAIAVTLAAVPGLVQKVSDLHRVVCGNGVPGLDERVRNLEDCLAQTKALTTTWKDRVWEIGKALFLLVAGAVIAAVARGA